jgi:hypothetical protein
MTEFNIKFIPNECECRTITFIDETIYTVESIQSPILKVTLPFNKYVLLEYKPNFINKIDAYTLSLVFTGKIPDLMEGMYKFELSVCPNDIVKKEFSYLFICPLLKRIGALLSKDKDINIQTIYINLLIAQTFANDYPDKACAIFEMSVKELIELENKYC